MKDYREFDKLVFAFSEDMKHFANTFAGTMPASIKPQLQDLMFTRFSKEIDAMTAQEVMEVKFKKRFYFKLLRAKSKLARLDKADAWFDKVFEKYFQCGVLEHLIVYAIAFLYKKNLFVPLRLFKQISNDEMLAQFTLAACEYLGWTASNEPIVQSIADETTSIVDESEPEEISSDSTEDATEDADEKTADVVSETETTTNDEDDFEVSDISDDEETISLPCEEKGLPSFYKPGGKPKKK